MKKRDRGGWSRYPETKPEHFQSPDILEIIAFPIDGLKEGDELTIELDRQQMEIH